MFKSGFRTFLSRFSVGMDELADSAFSGMTKALGPEDSARDEFMTVHILAKEPATVSRAAHLARRHP